MATLGFGEMVRSFFLVFEPMGGSGGYRGMPHVSLAYIWVSAAGILVGACPRTLAAVRSRCGPSMTTRPGGLVGFKTTLIKVRRVRVRRAVAAIAGGLFAHHHGYIDGQFGFEPRSIPSRSHPPPLDGRRRRVGRHGLLLLLPEWLRFLVDGVAAFGALLILMLLTRRQGILDVRCSRS